MTDADPDDEAHAMPPRHGGALALAALRHGIPRGDWLDLSTGINPEPWPFPAPRPPLSGDAFARLPDPADLARLIAAARAAYGVPDGVRIVAVPGSDIALRLLPALRPPHQAVILSPTYSGHAEAWWQAGHAVREVDQIDQIAAMGGDGFGGRDPAFDAIVLANPNNPDGRRLTPKEIAALLALLPADGLMIVDEAFADLDAGVGILGHLRDPRLVVLRSFGKFYGLAGLRIGFVLGEGAAVRRLAALMGDWPISGPAVTIGTAALADDAWRQATRRRLADRRARLDELLARHGLAIVGGTDLFRLVGDPRAATLHDHLARAGIWTRIFAERASAIRIGLPREDDLPRLAASLEGWRATG